MSKFDIRPQFECQNRILYVKCDIALIECKKKILNVKIRYSASVQMSKYDTRSQFGAIKRKT